MKKVAIIIGLVFGVTLVASAHVPLKNNRKHKAKFEVNTAKFVKHTKAENKINIMEVNRKFNKKVAEKPTVDTAEKSKTVDIRSRNHKLR